MQSNQNDIEIKLYINISEKKEKEKESRTECIKQTDQNHRILYFIFEC